MTCRARANARIYWGTGRGNYQRTGSYLVKPLQASGMSVTPALPEAGDILTYTISLRNPGPILPSAWLTDTLPAGLTYLGGLTACLRLVRRGRRRDHLDRQRAGRRFGDDILPGAAEHTACYSIPGSQYSSN